MLVLKVFQDFFLQLSFGFLLGFFLVLQGFFW